MEGISRGGKNLTSVNEKSKEESWNWKSQINDETRETSHLKEEGSQKMKDEIGTKSLGDRLLKNGTFF